VVYLDLAAPYAFCQGFWRPRIWLTAGLVDLFSDEELAAVLMHEAFHCRRYDPLRLLISQALKAAFFFFPLVRKLAEFSDLQQEVAADQSVIEYLGSDLSLLSALQKLLTQRAKQPTLSNATLNLFSVTEARLRRLIYPTQTNPVNWQGLLTTWAINLSVIAMLGSIGYLSTQPVIEHEEYMGTCAIEEVTEPFQTQLPPSNW
jgi:Zn-dependent protease with chaperone function